jgi:hypothetical protein
MEPLRRGATFYPGATSDVGLMQSPQQTIPAVPAAPPDATSATPAAPAPAPASVGRSPLGSIGDMYTGQYGNVLADPNASAFSHYLAGINQAMQTQQLVQIQNEQTQQRIQNLTTGPSPVEKLVKGIFGTQGEWNALKAHDQAAKTLGHPSVQQYLMHNPDQLAAAENDRVAYANQVPTPDFQKQLQTALAAQAEVQQNPKIPPENHHEVTNIMQTTGANSHQANASINPHAYTKEEFRKVFLGAPIQVVQSLFPELSHYITPEEALEKDYFGKVYGDYQDAVAELERMGAHDQQLKDNHQQPEYSQRPYFGYGKSKYDQQQDKVNKLNQFFMDQAAARIGVTAKPYPLPAKTD